MLREVSKVAGLAVLIAVALYASASTYYCPPKTIYCTVMDAFGPFYGKNLRGSLFAGFLTLGGFLLSLKTFIVVNMKKEVFENSSYKENWHSQKLIDSEGKLGGLYDPLRFLSTMLFISIVCCIATAVMQLTLGLSEHTWSAILCLFSGLLSSLLLVRSLHLIRLKLNKMFDFLEPKDPPSSSNNGAG